MTHTAPGRVRLSQQDRCFRVITGGRNIVAAPDPIADFRNPAAALRHADAAAKPSAPVFRQPQRRLISPEALFGLGYALGLATGALFMAFLIRAGVLL